jgi:hypothetical protein
MGDPHVKTWGGEWFDYHGECDLTLIHAPKLDMDIHVRSTIHYSYSYIGAAAVRIGKDILEVGSWGDFALNGIDGALRTDNHIPKLGGYNVEYKQVNKKLHTFDIVITPNFNVTIATNKAWVSVKISGAPMAGMFDDVTGLMGNYHGEKLSRDGLVMEDLNAFGQEWQVRPEEGNLFRKVRAPQYPQECLLPTLTKETGRRLGEAVDQDTAEKACEGLAGKAFELCVEDVMLSGDLDMADAGAY